MHDRVGQQLGNYRLLRLLGQGGQASVYLGEHVYLKSQAALKIRHSVLSEEEQKVFLQEAQTLVRLTHAHIVRVLDYALQDGMPFLVMEFAAHGTLRQRHPKGTNLPLDVIIPYVLQIASALQYVHDQGLVHRDIKPENLVLNSNDEVLLSDFGLVMHTPQLLSPDATEPIEQSLVGTTPYLAPEQLRGKAQPASDQYALGVVVYEWLCGKPPFRGPFLEVAMQHVSTPPPSLCEQVPDISYAVEEVVLRALAKEPERRFGRVQDFATALERAYQAPGTHKEPTFQPHNPVPLHFRDEVEKEQVSSIADLPRGTVTLLFTDMEGSTHLLQQLGDRYAGVLAECRRLMRAAFQQWNGHEIDTQGDGFFVVFARASDAISASVDAQRALASYGWPEGTEVRVRMGLHTGEPSLTAEGYVGMDVHRAARIMSAAHGGQVLLSQATSILVEQDLPDDVSLRDLGEHRLKDLGRSQRLFQLVISDLPADFPPLKTLDVSPNNLPIQPTPFIGREQELTAVGELLLREEVRLLTLTGPGGTGKTRLGLQVAAELSERFVDGVFFVALAPISDPAFVIPTIAETLGIREVGGQPAIERLKEALHQKQILLLLDNFEQVVSAASFVADLLAACPKLKILVTSREVLHVRAEHEFPVPPMDLPDPKHLPGLATLSHYTSVALFLQRAKMVKPDFQMTDNNARTIAEICARLDGLPLAIELAAARMKLLSPQALLARLSQRLQVLTSTTRDAPERQQTLRNTIAWSYQLLNAHEQLLFRRLSVFVDGWTVEAAEVVCRVAGELSGDVLDRLLSLVDKSLLRQEESTEGEPRFWMLQVLREFGLEQLAASREMEIVRGAHADYYLRLAEEAFPELAGPQQIRWFERLEGEHENLGLALSWLLERAHMEVLTKEVKEQPERALRLCVALFPFWYNRGYFREGWSFLERSLTIREGVKASLRARVLYNAGFLLWDMDDPERVEALAEESLALYRELRETAGMARSLCLLGAVVWRRGQYATARALDEEAGALFEQVGDSWGRGRCLTDLARMATAQGEYDRTRALLEESLRLYRALGDQQRIGWVLFLLAHVLFVSQGDLARASAMAEQSLALQREVGAKYFIQEPLALLAEIRLAQGEPIQARKLAEEGVTLSREVEVGLDETALICLARILASQGNHTAAHDLYQECLALLHKSGNKESIAICLESLGAVVAAQDKPHQAARLWGTADALRKAMGVPMHPVYRADYARAVAATRANLGEQAFAAAWAEGRKMTPEQVLAAKRPITISSPEPATQPLPLFEDT
jgi:predicted ATPase/serine/threonine protein kinase